MNQYSQISNAQTSNRQHDADGNLTSDGVKQYQWDGENRLIAVKQGSTTIAEYAYDYQSRRISKTVGASVKSFVYDGWNPIAEYTSALSPLSFTLSTSYTWGMDLSGSMQGAGGVGGLLAVKEFNTQNSASNTYYPTYDGNGNISEYVDATGAVVAHYEYDAFGQVVGSGAKSNDYTHQFSTKQLDSESGLHYYGYRYYDSSNGRWLGRDPIGEMGGVNVFSFVKNNSANAIDFLGMQDCAKCRQAWDEVSKTEKILKLKRLLDAKNCGQPTQACKCSPKKDSTLNGLYNHKTNKVIVFCRADRSLESYKNTFAHEWIHAVDHCYGDLSKGGGKMRACTEIRAYNYANCSLVKNDIQKRTCVRDGAIRSVSYSKQCKYEAEETVDAMMKSCYKK